MCESVTKPREYDILFLIWVMGDLQQSTPWQIESGPQLKEQKVIIKSKYSSRVCTAQSICYLFFF